MRVSTRNMIPLVVDGLTQYVYTIYRIKVIITALYSTRTLDYISYGYLDSPLQRILFLSRPLSKLKNVVNNIGKDHKTG